MSKPQTVIRLGAGINTVSITEQSQTRTFNHMTMSPKEITKFNRMFVAAWRKDNV